MRHRSQSHIGLYRRAKRKSLRVGPCRGTRSIARNLLQNQTRLPRRPPPQACSAEPAERGRQSCSPVATVVPAASLEAGIRSPGLPFQKEIRPCQDLRGRARRHMDWACETVPDIGPSLNYRTRECLKKQAPRETRGAQSENLPQGLIVNGEGGPDGPPPNPGAKT